MSEALNVRVPADLRNELQAEATRSGASLSDVTRRRLEKAATMGEIGMTGLTHYAGQIAEEFLPQLQGDKALQVYTEMINNSPTVQGVLFAIDMLMRQVDWHVTANGESETDERAADLVRTAMEDMSHSWEDLLSEVLTMLPYGWSYHELVYKRRTGQRSLEPGAGSAYDDGLIGWRKIPIRAQTTRYRWDIDEGGGIRGMWQQVPTMGKPPVFIPIEKALLFRPRQHKNNPEGMSALRAAWRPWYFVKRIEEIEAIGVERDLAGLPVAYIPGEHIATNSATFTAWKRNMRNLRRNEQEALILPSEVDPETKAPYYKVELLTTGGRRQLDISPIVERYDKRIALTMMADFIFLGADAVGSYALASNKTSLFAMALGAWLDGIAAVFNRHAIPRLIALNGIDVETPPFIQHGDIEVPDPMAIGDAVAKFTGAGMPLFGGPDALAVENWARGLVGAPEITDEMLEERERMEEERRAEEEEAARQELERVRGAGVAGAKKDGNEPNRAEA